MLSKKTYEPQFLDALQACVGPWEGTVWRQVFDGTDPLRENIRGGRWNPPDVAALYCSLDAGGAAAELRHLNSLQPIAIRKPQVRYEIRLSLSGVADLITDEPLVTLGLSREALLDDNWGAPQRIGSALHWLGCGGAIVPSARHASGNFVVYVNNLGPDDSMEPVSSERTGVAEPPA